MNIEWILLSCMVIGRQSSLNCGPKRKKINDDISMIDG